MAVDMADANKVVGYITIGAIFGVFLFGVLAFFKTPAYANTVDMGVKAFVDILTFAIGAKAGLSIPRDSSK